MTPKSFEFFGGPKCGETILLDTDIPLNRVLVPTEVIPVMATFGSSDAQPCHQIYTHVYKPDHDTYRLIYKGLR